MAEQHSGRVRAAVVAILAIVVLLLTWSALRPDPEPDPVPGGTATGPADTSTPPVEREPRVRRHRDAVSAQADANDEADAVAEEPAVEPRTGTRVTPAEFTIRVLDDEDGSPIAGAIVRRQAGGSVTCDANGAATVQGTVEVPLPFRAEAPGYVRSDWVLLAAVAGRPSEIRLQRSLIVEGVVVSAGDGTPVPRAKVTVHSGAGSSVGADPPLAKTTTDSGGNFRLEGMPFGDTVTVIVVAERHATLREVRKLPTRPTDPLRFEVEPAAELVGRVWLPSGDPAPRAKVYLVPADKPELLPVAESGARMMGRPDWLVTRTDAEGRFTLKGLLTDRRYVAVATRSGWTASPRTSPLDPSALPAALDLHLRAPGSIVVDVSVRGEPPQDLAVLLGPKGIKRGTAVRRSDGKWLLESVPAGEKKFHVKAKGFATYEGTVVVESGVAAQVRVELTPR